MTPTPEVPPEVAPAPDVVRDSARTNAPPSQDNVLPPEVGRELETMMRKYGHGWAVSSDGRVFLPRRSRLRRWCAACFGWAGLALNAAAMLFCAIVDAINGRYAEEPTP